MAKKDVIGAAMVRANGKVSARAFDTYASDSVSNVDRRRVSRARRVNDKRAIKEEVEG